MEPLVGCLIAWFAGIRITDTHTDTQDNCCNPRCACAPRVNQVYYHIYKWTRVHSSTVHGPTRSTSDHRHKQENAHVIIISYMYMYMYIFLLSVQHSVLHFEMIATACMATEHMIILLCHVIVQSMPQSSELQQSTRCALALTQGPT